MRADWHVLTTEPRREFAAARGLIGHGVTTYLPTVLVRVRAAPITRKPFRLVDRQLFPGYLFARIASGGDWKAVHSVSGLSGYLRGPEGPKLISEAAIASVMHMEDVLLLKAKEAAKMWMPGDVVEISGDEWSAWKNRAFRIEEIDKTSRATLLLIAKQSWPVRVTAPVIRLKECACE